MSSNLRLAIETPKHQARIRPLAGKTLKVAVVHDWLDTYAGAEKVIEQILKIYPGADVFALVDFMSAKDRTMLGSSKVHTSFIARLPFARTKFRNYLALMPLAIEQFDLSGYDLVISSSHAVAKGVITSGTQLHVSYLHSPIRYAWDMQHQYLQESKLTSGFRSALARAFLHYMRLWDARTAQCTDLMVANSRYIARRAERCYGLHTEVLYPPVDTSSFTLQPIKQDYYLTASRMVPYKRVPCIVEAFAQMPDKQLVVIGDGPEMAKVKALATPNVKVLGHVAFDVLKQHMQNAKAFVFAAEEDFGIAPVEAQACGTPVIAFGKGGALETVREAGVSAAPTGLFFNEQSPKAIVEAINRFETLKQAPLAEDCRANAMQFSSERFRAEFKARVDRAIAEFGY